MALKEQDIVLVAKDVDGTKVIQMPITRVENVEGAVKTVNGVEPDGTGNISISSVTTASQDSEGNIITSTYAKKLELTQGLASKASLNHSHNISDLPKATTLEAEAGLDDTKVMTPAVTKSAILKLAPAPDLSSYAKASDLSALQQTVASLQNTINALPNTFLAKSGGTLTGPLIVQGEVKGKSFRVG